jgi:hypothetical protein
MPLPPRRATAAAFALLAAAASASAAAPPAPPAPQATPMTTDFAPSVAFRAHAASVLHVPVAKVKGGAANADVAGRMPNGVGGAWGYVVWTEGDGGEQELRGWATADAQVITPEHNLGRLLVEAGVWNQPPPVPSYQLAEQLARALLWALGPSYVLVAHNTATTAAPALTVGAGGAGSLVFFASAAAAPGGGRPGPATTYRFDVAFTAAHAASLRRTAVAAP